MVTSLLVGGKDLRQKNVGNLFSENIHPPKAHFFLEMDFHDQYVGWLNSWLLGYGEDLRHDYIYTYMGNLIGNFISIKKVTYIYI